jgi:hypothetical protein
MVIRHRILVCFLASLFCVSAFGAYKARLYFENLTTGVQNAGLLLAKPGDTVGLHLFFDYGGTLEKLDTVQTLICLEGKSMISDEDANTFRAQCNKSFRIGTTGYIYKASWQPSDGPIYDNAYDPTDATSPFVCGRAIVGFLNGGERLHEDIDFFKFTVMAGSVGEVLNWDLIGRDTGTGLSTRRISNSYKTEIITDNYLQVVPEPTVALLALPLAFIARRQATRR